MRAWAIIVAAGAGRRMGLVQNKALLPLAGKPMLRWSVDAFAGLVDGVVVVARQEDMEAVLAMGLGATVVPGGDTRQQSVLAGLAAIEDGEDIVLVHDAARPLVSKDVIRRCLESAREFGSGVACVPVKDTIKRVNEDGFAEDLPGRESLRAAQTPQAFRAGALRQAIQRLEEAGKTATDDAAAMEAAGELPRQVEGDPLNSKITVPEDMRPASLLLEAPRSPRVGHGYDAHRLAEGRPLVLCGVTIPYEKGLLGHSDADAPLHALMDALLGAAALGDIGRHFPDSDPKYEGVSSATLLSCVAQILKERGFVIGNADITIVAQRPKLKDYIAEMVVRTAQAMEVSVEAVSVKATTTEGMGFEGEGLGIAAHAVALVYAPESSPE